MRFRRRKAPTYDAALPIALIVAFQTEIIRRNAAERRQRLTEDAARNEQIASTP